MSSPPQFKTSWNTFSLIAAAVFSAASCGCDMLDLPLDLFRTKSAAEPSLITAHVTAVNSQTGLPTKLTGQIEGEYAGTYEETILEVYFDDQGAPLAAFSESRLTLTAPEEGVIVSFNLILVEELIFMTDDSGAVMVDAQGMPVVTGLRSSSNGEIILGAGGFEGMVGSLHSDSTLTFGTGASGLGALESDLSIRVSGVDQAFED